MNLKTFCINKNIEYHEKMIDNGVFNKLYEIKNPMQEDIIAIPDGCVDIQVVWKNGNIQTHLCGSFTQGAVSRIGNYDKCFGIKLNLGIVPNVIRRSIREVIGNRVQADGVIDVQKLERILDNKGSFENHVDSFMQNFDIDISDEDEIASYIIDILQEKHGNIVVSDVINNLGYSQCYSNRVFKNYIGFSIKKYAVIIRQQEAIEMMLNGDLDIAYEELGYYDQAHFLHDFKKFTTLTPKIIEEQRVFIK